MLTDAASQRLNIDGCTLVVFIGCAAFVDNWLTRTASPSKQKNMERFIELSRGFEALRGDEPEDAATRRSYALAFDGVSVSQTGM
jgi:hypothetical protein